MVLVVLPLPFYLSQPILGSSSSSPFIFSHIYPGLWALAGTFQEDEMMKHLLFMNHNSDLGPTVSSSGNSRSWVAFVMVKSEITELFWEVAGMMLLELADDVASASQTEEGCLMKVA